MFKFHKQNMFLYDNCTDTTFKVFHSFLGPVDLWVYIYIYIYIYTYIFIYIYSGSSTTAAAAPATPRARHRAGRLAQPDLPTVVTTYINIMTNTCVYLCILILVNSSTIINIITLVADKWGNTNGAAAKAMVFDGLGKKVRPGTFGEIKVG